MEETILGRDNKSNVIKLILILSCIFLSIAGFHQARADPLNVVEFDSPLGVTLNDNAFFDIKESGGDTDCAEKGNGPISVTIKSIKPDTTVRDTITLQAIEISNPTPGLRIPTSNTCIFGATFLYFSPDNQRFAIESTAKITQHDTSGGKATNGVVDTIPVTVSSTSDPGFSMTLTETGPNTGIFQGTIKFTSGATVPSSALHVSQGDIITAVHNGHFSYGQILPSPSGSAGLLVADVGDTIEATYNGVSGTTVICSCGGEGGGGGGLVRPGFVLDVIQALRGIGGSPFIVTPPSFGGGLFHYDDGLTIIQNNIKKTFDISKYNQEIPHQVLVENQPVNMTFKIYENYNPNAVVHSGLYFIPRGSDMIIPNSIAHIIYEKDRPVQVSDPNKLLTNVSATFNTNGTFEYVTFQFTPTRSYDKMSFLDRTWNDHRYSTDVRIHDEAAPVSVTYALPDGILEYSYSDFITKLDADGYYKPQIMAHIHDTNDVFGTKDNGHVYWLYNTTDQSVTLKITDKERNMLFSNTEKLVKKNSPVQNDYNFMKFTEQQLNRWDITQEQKIMENEVLKAIEHASIKYPGYPFSKW